MDRSSAAFARDRLEAAVLEYVRGGFRPHDIARLVSEIAIELAGQKEWAESITPRRSRPVKDSAPTGGLDSWDF